MSNLELMNSLLDFRKADQTFQKSISQRSTHMDFKFFDGPPFTNGTPHYGHLLAGSIKDVIPRFKTMKGYRVQRKWGWDCHGLPVEKAVEKELGIDGKKDIEEKIGIQTFVEKCRSYVNQVNDDWKWFVDRTGRWVDMENPYFTMDLDFMESVIWAFSSIYHQNKVYKGFKVQGYCPSCATPLANNEISDGYEDRQDNAITVKFALQHTPNKKQYSYSEDGFVDVVAGVIQNEQGAYAMVHHSKEHLWFFPGGKVDAGESLEEALSRELKEEVGIAVKSSEYLGSIKIVHLGVPCRVHRYQVTTPDTPSIQEPEKHGALKWIKAEAADNSLGFVINIEGTLIDDEVELAHDFVDFYLFTNVLNPQEEGQKEGKFNFLAWTTTPWTLPSNMYLAMGAEIEYVTVYDPESKEYYIMAAPLLKKYYKSPDQYQLIYKQKGKEFANLKYQPLFDYIPNSTITQNYKDQFFQVLLGDFVSTEDGTGIVHIAPTFGEIDFMAVAEKLGEQNSLEWLFMPVDEYGNFDHQVPDYAGISVFEANGLIMEALKQQKKTVKSESITHSYPHCWRCKTPLIYKAMSSRFIKEKEMNTLTHIDAEQIKFVPETVKNRFVNGLQSAPDWNIARNRYRGSPLPIWQNTEDPEDRISLGTLEEIYQFSKTGSKNLTKNIFIRHGETDFNAERKYDGLGEAILNEKGKEQAQELTKQLANLQEQKSDLIFIISPLQRTWQTIKPLLLQLFGETTINEVEKKYFELHQQYQPFYQNKTLAAHLQGNDTSNVFQLHEQIFIDRRMTERYATNQGEYEIPGSSNWKEPDLPVFGEGESTNQLFERVKNAVQHWNQKFPTKTLIYSSHKDPIGLARKAFRDFDYSKQRDKYALDNGKIATHYRDNARNTEADLHKPYVDSYRGIKEGKTYKRIPEVMDCRFESGAMPFGQDHYIGQEEKQISYPADFIAEGLDQTRGRFRSLHVVGHALKKENAFKNVIVNGLILAEDGKKMSKSLKNYPDPKLLIEKRGGDAFRLYVLNSPVVRAEPMKFAEKGVEQAFKDVLIPLENVFKFFETYAKIDQWQSPGTEIFLLRHAEAVGHEVDAPLSEKGKAALQSPEILENIIRLDPEIIIHTPYLRSKATAEILQERLLASTGNNIDLREMGEVGTENFAPAQMEQRYQQVLQEYAGKRVLIVGHDYTLRVLRELYYGEKIAKDTELNNLEIIELPSYKIANELDKWILAEINTTLLTVDEALENYRIDLAIKAGADFIEKLTNRYLRRSRRRFWESGMETDKISAYHTLFRVLKTYLQIMAPFVPFITEEIWLKLQNFSQRKQSEQSIHLSFWPFANSKYINQTMIQEVAKVRQIIKLGLFIRSRNKIAIKQPLKSLKVNL